MDSNHKKDRVAGFLGQSFVRIPRKVFTMFLHGKGREKSIGLVYLTLISEVYFAEGCVSLQSKAYKCRRGEYVGTYKQLMECAGVSLATVRRGLKWLKQEGLIEINQLLDGSSISVCAYDFIVGERLKGDKGKDDSGFEALEAAERLMGGRSMQFDYGSDGAERSAL